MSIYSEVLQALASIPVPAAPFGPGADVTRSQMLQNHIFKEVMLGVFLTCLTGFKGLAHVSRWPFEMFQRQRHLTIFLVLLFVESACKHIFHLTKDFQFYFFEESFKNVDIFKCPGIFQSKISPKKPKEVVHKSLAKLSIPNGKIL